MKEKKDEILEYYFEIFHNTIKRVRKNRLDLDTLKVILLHGIIDESIIVLNLMGK